MSLEVICPGCQESFRAKDEWAGKQTKCPKCGCGIVIAGEPTATPGATVPSSSRIGPAPNASVSIGPAPSAPVPSAPSPAGAAKPLVAKVVAKAKRLEEPRSAAPTPTIADGRSAGGTSAGDSRTVDSSAAAPYVAVPHVAGPSPSAPLPVFPSPVIAAPFAIDISAVSSKKGAATKAPPPSAAPSAAGAGAPPARLSPRLLAGISVAVALAAVGGWWFARGGGKPLAASTPEQAPPATSAVPFAPSDHSAPSPRPPEDLADVVERLKTGIVLLTSLDEDGDELGLGTGFVIPGDRRVVTNYHVIEGGARATARFSSGIITEVTAVIAVDEKRDLAIVELNFVPPEVVPLSITTDAQLRQGTKVIAIGHPNGLDYSVTEGIISAIRTTIEMPEDVRKFLEAPDDQQWIQTTAAISGGNSGGPLMLPDGRVIGINTWVAGGENLGFAGHARHIVELAKSEPEPAGITLAAYNKKHGGLERAIVDEVDAFDVTFAEILKQVEAADWRPTKDENKDLIRRAAGSTAFARPRGLAIRELNELTARLKTHAWDYEDHVQALNDFTVDCLTNNPGPVMFFGRVVGTFQETHVSLVQLEGRGYLIEVYDFVDSKKRRAPGERLLVMGMRPPRLETMPQRVAAGMVVNVEYPQSPDDVARRQLRDLVHFGFDTSKLPPLFAAPERNFPEVEFAAAKKPPATFQLRLNESGQGFDAVRLPASTGAADDEVVWSVTAPPGALGKWGVTSLDGFIPTGVDRFLAVDDYQPPKMSLPPRNETFLVHVSGQELKDSRKHLLWFEFSGTKPVDVTITGAYRGRFTSRPQRTELFAALGLPEVGGRETRRAQYLLSKRPVGTGGAAAAVASVEGVRPQPPATRKSAPIKGKFPRADAGRIDPSRHGISSSWGITMRAPQDPSDRPLVALPVARQGNYPLRMVIEADGKTLVVSPAPAPAYIRLSPGDPFPSAGAAVRAEAQGDLQLLQNLGAITLVASAGPDGKTQLTKIDPREPPSGTYREPYGFFLEGKPLDDDAAERITVMPFLSIAAIRNADIDDSALARLLSGTNINILVVQNVSIGDAALLAAANLNSLSVALLDYTEISSRGVEELLRQPNMAQLSVRGTPIDGSCLESITATTRASWLDLSETSLNDHDLEPLTRLQNLSDLAISRLKIGPAGMQHVVRIKRLLNLNLDYVPLNAAMVDELTKLSNLRYLSVKGCGLNAADLRRLSDAMPKATIEDR